MSQNNMELAKWKDGETCLAFWDSIYFEDRIFVLTKDGEFEKEYGDDYDILHPINLREELIKLAEKLSNKQ